MDEQRNSELLDVPYFHVDIHAAGADAAIALPEQAVVYDLLCEQQSLDSVDVRSPLADQPAPLTMQTPQILLVDTWNAHHATKRAARPGTSDQRS